MDEVRGELDALMRKRAELLPAQAAREPVVAPISGVVSVSNATIGQIVDARDVLFEIVDPSQFWVEAHGHAHSGLELGASSKAFAIIAGSDKLPLEFAGRGLALRHQATVLSFKIMSSPAGLAVGTPVTVVVQTPTPVDGFVLPSAALVRGSTGLPIIWVKSEPERFEPHTVKVEPLDGTSVLVTAGLKDDQRVVTEGATLLNQVR
jgi:membrane fusion protein, heavy metal efflux system